MCRMNRHEFTLELISADKLTDNLARTLFRAGCLDASVWESKGRVFVTFQRSANTLSDAVKSATRDIHTAGHTVIFCEAQQCSVSLSHCPGASPSLTHLV